MRGANSKISDSSIRAFLEIIDRQIWDIEEMTSKYSASYGDGYLLPKTFPSSSMA
jgi:hypothetical protein